MKRSILFLGAIGAGAIAYFALGKKSTSGSGSVSVSVSSGQQIIGNMIQLGGAGPGPFPLSVPGIVQGNVLAAVTVLQQNGQPTTLVVQGVSSKSQAQAFLQSQGWTGFTVLSIKTTNARATGQLTYADIQAL